MGKEAFHEALNEMYQGEVVGEVLLELMLGFFTDTDQRYKVAVMLQLETETKARLRPALMALGLDIAEPEASRQLGRDLAEGLRGKTWQETMQSLAEVIKPYVERYESAASESPAEFRAVPDSMVRHEQALYDFVVA